jgi:hypothetical protein
MSGGYIQVFFNNGTNNQSNLNNENPQILLIIICCLEKYGTIGAFQTFG